MTDNLIPIPKANDAQVLDFFAAIERDFSFASAAITLQGTDGTFSNESGTEPIELLRANRSFSIRQAICARNATYIIFERGFSKPNPANAAQTINEPSASLDTIIIRFNKNPLAPAELINLNSLIQSTFYTTEAVKFLQANDEGVISSAIASHHQIVTKLEQTLAEIGQKFTEERLALEQNFLTRKQEQDSDLENRTRELQALHEHNVVQLEDERQQLRDREQSLDDRDNTHVRREIRKQFKEHLAEYKKAFQLTAGTQQLRKPIHITVWMSVLLLGLGIWLFTSRSGETPDTWLSIAYLVKPLALTVATIALITWYLRWMTRWSDRHADAEFQFKQLELDMDRASWVVETAFEWKNREENAIPDHLLEAVSRNLFTRPDAQSETDVHPVDQLASALLGQASQARLNIGGNELEFGRRALSKAGKAE